MLNEDSPHEAPQSGQGGGRDSSTSTSYETMVEEVEVASVTDRLYKMATRLRHE